MPRVQTAFADRLGIDMPILGFSHSIDVTAAITKAGGMGVYGIAHDPPESVAARVGAIRRQVGSRPFGIDIMMPKGMPEGEDLASVQAALPREHVEFVEQIESKYQVPKATKKTFYNTVLRSPAYFEGQLQALLETDVDLVAFGIGLTADAVARLKGAGKVVGALIGSPRHFDAYRDIDLDFIVAQGSEAGAHTGSIGTMVLVPEIVQRAGGLPVLAAGGIGHGAQIAAALAMGAQGVWMGTSWLTTQEHARGDHAIGDKLRQKLFAAGSGDTRITRGSSGKPQRQIRSAWTEEWAAPSAPEPLKMPYQHALVGDLMTAIEEHEVDPLLHSPAGQSVAWSTDQKSVAQVVEALGEQTVEALDRAGTIAKES